MIYTFGDYELDQQRVELRCTGEPCKLEPQEFKVLTYLLENRERVVTKEELFAQIWPDQFVSEATLSQRIMTIRKALGESGRSPRCIKTIHGHGYRFIAEVEVQESRAENPKVTAAISPASGTTQYAQNGTIHIAYQVTGTGPFDLVFVPGWVSHVEYAWEEPRFSRFLKRLSSFCRLITLDRRGTGLSDPVTQLPTLEERMDDVRAVMDAVGSERAVLFGISESGPMCQLFAATYPERTLSLVLCCTFAKLAKTPDYPWGHTEAAAQKFLGLIMQRWGTGLSAQAFAPSLAHDPQFVESWGRFERLSVSPGSMHTLIQIALSTDARHILSAIQVPTLVIHRVGDLVNPVGGARYMADHIAGATYVELPGDDHFPWVGDIEEMLGEVEEFLTGVRHEPVSDRILATVLFTDIVSSTERAAELGDRQWRDLLERHHRLVRGELQRFRGQEVDTAGDGFFATFDGPARAIQCACAVRSRVKRLGLTIRAGLHTGECEVMGDKVTGMAVHIGSRVAGKAAPSEVLVSNTVKDLVVGSGLEFTDRGVHELKGVPGEWHLFAA